MLARAPTPACQANAFRVGGVGGHSYYFAASSNEVAVAFFDAITAKIRSRQLRETDGIRMTDGAETAVRRDLLAQFLLLLFRLLGLV